MASTMIDRAGTLNTSLAIKAPCRVATTADINSSLTPSGSTLGGGGGGLITIDGVTLAAGDRVLVKNQADQTKNGIWLASSTPWTYDQDWNNRGIAKGTVILVTDGTLSGGTFFELTTSSPNVGSSNMTFAATSIPAISSAMAPVVAAATLAAARTALGDTVVGDALFTAASAAAAAATLAVLPLAGGAMTGTLNEVKGANIASAATTNIFGATDGNYHQVTGTATITGLGTAQAGAKQTVEFAGALTLTNNASIILFGSNIKTAAGDVAEFISEGAGVARCSKYSYANGTAIQVFTASGTYTPTPGMRYCIAEAVGGGGSGGGAQATGAGAISAGSGGNAGAYARARLTATQIGASQAVTIGAGGTAVSGSTGNPGTATTLGALLSAAGGEGGVGGGPSTSVVTNSAAPSQSATGDFKGWTGLGGPGFGMAVGVQLGGNGADSPLGGGGSPGVSNATGIAGSGPGAAGGGASNTQSSGNRSGGAGANGLLIIFEFFS